MLPYLALHFEKDTVTLSKTAMIPSNTAKLTLCIGKLRLSLKAKEHGDTLKDINKNKSRKQ